MKNRGTSFGVRGDQGYARIIVEKAAAAGARKLGHNAFRISVCTFRTILGDYDLNKLSNL
jgi:hypothetical protein